MKYLEKDEAIDMTFGAWLSGLRRQRVLMKTELCEKVGMGLLRLDAIEDGLAIPGITKGECERIAQALGIPVNVVRSRAIGRMI